MIHIKWKGKGWIVFLSTFLCSFISKVITRAITKDDTFYQSNPYPLSIALFVSALFTFYLNHRLNTTLGNGKKQLKNDSSLFFIPIAYWGWILLACGIFNIIVHQLEMPKKEEIVYVSAGDHRIELHYDKDAALTAKISYKKNSRIKDGDALYRNKSGLLMEEHWENGIHTGHYTEYYNNNKPKRYICYGPDGAVLFYREYDSTSKIIRDTGDISALTIASLYDDDIKKDSIVWYTQFIVKPPFCSLSFDSHLVRDGSNDTAKCVDSIVDGWAYQFAYKIPREGNYTYFQDYGLIDSFKTGLMTRRMRYQSSFHF